MDPVCYLRFRLLISQDSGAARFPRAAPLSSSRSPHRPPCLSASPDRPAGNCTTTKPRNNRDELRRPGCDNGPLRECCERHLELTGAQIRESRVRGRRRLIQRRLPRPANAVVGKRLLGDLNDDSNRASHPAKASRGAIAHVARCGREILVPPGSGETDGQGC